MPFSSLLAVILGGGLGAGMRFFTYRLLCQYIKGEVFYFLATLSVNIIGCLILGVILGFFSSREGLYSKDLVLFLGTGFCGGFTTFSTFSLEGLSLIQKGELSLFAMYIISSLGLGLLCGLAGLLIGKSL